MRTLFLNALVVLAVLGSLPAHAAYVDNGDGTVTDTVTGLMWDKCPYGQTASDCSGGSAFRFAWKQALVQTVALNGISYKGHNDWRLPSVKELESLAVIGPTPPAIDELAFPNTDRTQPYWSSTLSVHDSTAWTVHFYQGDVNTLDWTLQANNSFMRIVRSGQTGDNFDLLAPQTSVTVTGGGTGQGTVTGTGINCTINAGSASGTCSGVVAGGVLTATPAAGSVFVGWLGACIGTGACNAGAGSVTSVSATFAPTTVPLRIDIDGNNSYDALTDGLLMLRYLFGLSGAALTNSVIGTGATRSTPTQILQQLDNIRPLLDVDGNGQADSLTDGLLLIRYLFGLRGPALINGAVGTGATRTTALVIEPYIQSLMP